MPAILFEPSLFFATCSGKNPTRLDAVLRCMLRSRSRLCQRPSFRQGFFATCAGESPTRLDAVLCCILRSRIGQASSDQASASNHGDLVCERAKARRTAVALGHVVEIGTEAGRRCALF